MEEAEVSIFSLPLALCDPFLIQFKDIQKVCDRFEVNRKATAVDRASYLQRRRGRYL